jgi:ribonuclease P protein component
MNASRRLKRRGEFLRVYRQGLRAKTAGLSLCIAPNEGGPSRLGLAVPGTAGNAPARNRAKRLLREGFRALQARIPEGIDCVLTVHDAEALPHLEAAQEKLLLLLDRLAGRQSCGRSSSTTGTSPAGSPRNAGSSPPAPNTPSGCCPKNKAGEDGS